MDLRIVKTIDLIIDAFFDCLETMDFQQITVKHLTQMARINRSTFYKHFEDKYQLRDYIMDDILHDFETNLETDFLFEENLDDGAYIQKLIQCLNHFQKRKHQYELLWNHLLLERSLFEEMIEIGTLKMKKQIVGNPRIALDRKENAEWYACLLLNNILVSVRWWFSQPVPLEAKELAQMIIRHMCHGTIPTLLGR